jgi:peptidoglycan/LPS O-acetylase OafA/YrhL
MEQQRRLSYLDGLRAVAVLLVIAFHIRVHTAGVQLEHVFKECSHGVDLFFVLSGLCLSLPTIERVRKAGAAKFDVAGYAIKRALRILPPYLVALAILAAVAETAFAHGFALPDGMHHLDPTDLLSEVFFLDRNNQLTNQSFWSLAIEFRWYFVFPLALALWIARPRSLLLTLGLVAVASECTRAASTDLAMLDAFLLGIVAAHIRVYGHPIGRYGMAIFAIGAVLGLALETSYRFPVQANAGWHLAGFGFIVYAGHAQWLQRILSSRPMVAIGTASYSIYLVHEPIVSFLVARTGPGPMGVAVSYVAALGSALTAGAVLWFFVERPLTDPAFVRKTVTRLRSEVSSLLGRCQIPDEVELRSSFTLEGPRRPAPVLDLRGRAGLGG